MGRVTLFEVNAENVLRNLRDARRAINAEFELDPATNLYARQMPDWVCEVSAALHAAQGNLINAIDPTLERPHGWWESL